MLTMNHITSDISTVDIGRTALLISSLYDVFKVILLVETPVISIKISKNIVK